MSRSGGVVLAAAFLVACAAPLMLAAQDSETTGGPPPNAESPKGGAFPIDVIFTDLASDPSSDVPGIPGAKFSSFDRPHGSPGTNWILTADTDLTSTEDEILLVNGVVEVREGTPATWTGGAENVGFLDQRCAINDAGEFVFTTNTDGPTDTDEYVVKGSPAEATLTKVVQEGDSADPPLTGATWDEALESALIIADGTVGFGGDSIDGVPTDNDEVIILGATILAQEGLTTPSGQSGGATDAWDNFDTGDFWTSADGSSWLLQGDLTTADTTQDDVVVVDGAVVLQEGVVVPGSTFPNPIDLGGIVGSWMDPVGNWFARGNNDTSEVDWLVRNGTVIATLGDPAYTGSTEVWTDAEFGDCFFLHVGDVNGNWIIGGVTDGATASNGLIVLNGEMEVMREGDPIDIDGNGLFDDDAFFNTFGNDDGYITSTGLYYFTATIKDATGTQVGEGFFAADLSSVIPVELQSFSVE